MKFSKAWLEEWVSPVPENEEFFNQLTMAGLEVDGYEEVGDGLSGVVIAEIQSIIIYFLNSTVKKILESHLVKFRSFP